MKQHPLSALFPAMPPDELLALSQDIAKRGLKHSVTMFDGMVLDGWNRVQACQMAGVPVREIRYTGNDPIGFVWAENLLHRHLTASQRAMIEVQLREWVSSGANVSRGAPGAALAEMAKESGTSERTILQAKQVEKNGSDELKDAVKSGEISVKKAAEVAKQPKAKQPKALKAAQAPKPKEPKPDHPTTVAWEKFADLQERYDALAEHCEDLTDELKTSVALMGTDAAIEMQKVREELRLCARRKNELMASNHQMRKEIGVWQARAKKAGWKAP